MPLSPGQLIFQRYQVVRILGQGGYGVVYLVQDTRLSGRIVALKESFDNTPAAAQQFKFEAETLAKLRHPALVNVTDLFELNGHNFFVMDYIEGADLNDLIKTGRVTEQQAITWMLEICDAVAFLHAQNPPIIHRDIKPQNIKIRQDGHAILVDFGIAKVYVPKKQTVQVARAVSAGFSSPEQYGSGTDARSDVYSLGATLYCAVTTRVPPEAMDILSGTAQLVPPRAANPRLNPTLEQIILQSMSLNSLARYPSAREMTQALQTYVRGGTVIPVQSVPPAMPTAQGVRCPACGYINRAGAKFCQRDRTPLGGLAPMPSIAPAMPAAPPAPVTTPQMHFEMGNAFARKKDYQRAMQEYAQAQRGGFEHAALYNNWANVCIELDRAEEAIQILQTGIGRYSNDADLYGQLGFAYAINGQHPQALQVLQRALALNPTAETHFLLGLVYQKLKDDAHAIVELRQYLAAEDGAVFPRFLLAQSLFRANQHVEAQSECQHILRLDPQYDSAYTLLAAIHNRNKRYTDAIKAAQSAIKIKSTSLAQFFLGDGYKGLKKWNEAIRAYEESARLNPEDPDPHWQLAVCYLELKRRADARRELQEVVALDPNNQDARDALRQI